MPSFFFFAYYKVIGLIQHYIHINIQYYSFNINNTCNLTCPIGTSCSNYFNEIRTLVSWCHCSSSLILQHHRRHSSPAPRCRPGGINISQQKFSDGNSRRTWTTETRAQAECRPNHDHYCHLFLHLLPALQSVSVYGIVFQCLLSPCSYSYLTCLAASTTLHLHVLVLNYLNLLVCCFICLQYSVSNT